jgi:type VI secretion system secreted protein Hcp
MVREGRLVVKKYRKQISIGLLSALLVVSTLLVNGCNGIIPIPEIPKPSPEEVAEPTEPAEPLTHSSGYVKFDGIDGEATDSEHQKWSEIVSTSWRLHQADSEATGSARERGVVIFDDLVIVKQVDKASPKLSEACATGKVFPKVEIHLTGPSEGSTCQGTFFVYELTNVQVVSYTLSGSNPLAYALFAPAPDISTMPSTGPFIVQAVDAPMEEFALNYAAIKVTYTECDSAGNALGNVEFNWNVEQAQFATGN